jgi:hypothetical protein
MLSIINLFWHKKTCTIINPQLSVSMPFVWKKEGERKRLMIMDRSIYYYFAFFLLRYMKYLYPYECEKLQLSSPGELQAAIGK